ncbi:twisted gastrulation protein homolog 1-like [Limulus polyphemus]|uniref:Twisted gastrulation protein homolog 1-like n=1 Tax=Limulus polyphemus TaxID=6850 RepID=A0ABM1BML0_LIMPO|nr:twisted gastrulation protein homolog 1-like [Limulus polyphemus]
MAVMERGASLILIASCFVSFLSVSQQCNEAVCGSIVSKCMLTQSCKCEKANSTCSRNCFLCLDDLYIECCSCVGLCPKPNDTDTDMSKKSHVEDLSEPIPVLFTVLTEKEDHKFRWISYTFPAHLSFITLAETNDIKVSSVWVDNEVDFEEQEINCTVAYMSQCTSWNKCKNSCRSMGAASYRWFHDGCCECIGSTCINYGINESRCYKCPVEKEEVSEEENEVVKTHTKMFGGSGEKQFGKLEITDTGKKNYQELES